MIVYKNILEKLKAAGYTTYRLRTEKIISQSVLTRIRNGESLSVDTLNKICTILNCDVSDIMEIRPDND